MKKSMKKRQRKKEERKKKLSRLKDRFESFLVPGHFSAEKYVTIMGERVLNRLWICRDGVAANLASVDMLKACSCLSSLGGRL